MGHIKRTEQLVLGHLGDLSESAVFGFIYGESCKGQIDYENKSCRGQSNSSFLFYSYQSTTEE
jgi:hypothetical protein